MGPLLLKAREAFPNKTDEELQAMEDSGQLSREMVRENIRQKLGSDYSDTNRQKILAENEESASGPNWRAGLAALGAGISGQNALNAGQTILNQDQRARQDRLDQFDTGKKDLLSQVETEDKLGKMAMDSATQSRESDPNSPESKVAQSLAKSMGMDPLMASKLTATQFKQFGPSLQKKYDIEQSKLARSDAQADRFAQAEARRQDKQEEQALKREYHLADVQKADTEKQMQLQTPYGLANTQDDAKKLKDAHEEKKSFDNKLSQIIQLRKDNNGGAILDRTAVDRGKQLSSELLLNIKNLEKLGVLSTTDEALIRKIIPSDPLEYTSLAAAIQGQDPILSNLQAYKEDSDKDFQTRVGTRIRDTRPKEMVASTKESSIFPEAQAGNFPRQVFKEGKKATVSNQSELEDANRKGWQ